MTSPKHVARLESWIEQRRQSAGLRELAFYPGSDREISMDDAAWLALALIEGYESGEEPHEA